MSKYKTASKVADYLLQIKAINLQPANPFQWASGWFSPLYCDNRKILSYPNIRKFIREALTLEIKSNFRDVQVIAGVATGAIALGALVAEELNLPFVYVRSSSKGHGLQNQVEGDLKPGQRVVVIEDLVSTGMSSLNAVEALEKAGSDVLGMCAVFTYGFPVAEQNFLKHHCRLIALSNYDVLIERALEKNYVDASQLSSLKEWRKDPANWRKDKLSQN